jgi:tetratricopeptide (TPR) repeat protein
LFFFLTTSIVCGQEKKISKYKSLNKRDFSLEQDVPKLLKEAQQLSSIDIKGALDKVEEALALSITQKNILHEAQCYLFMGKINEEIKEWQSAAENYLFALEKLAKDYSATTEYFQCLNGLAKSFTEMGNLERALYYQNKKLSSTDEPKLKAETYIDLANIYFLSRDFQEAEKSIEKANSIINTFNITQLKSAAQATNAKILANTGDLDAAESLYQQSQNIEINKDDPELTKKNEEILETSKEEIIDAYNREERLDDEIEMRNQAISSNTRKQKPNKVVVEKQALSKALFNLGNRTAAIRELEEAIELADSIDDYQSLAQANRVLAEIWSELGNASQSLQYYQKYSLAMDEVQKQAKTEQRTKEAILKKQQEILSLSKELALDESEYELQRTSTALEFNKEKLQRFIIYGLSILLVLVILASFFNYRNAIKSKTMSQLLALKSLRSQMNPHFIFNALNSVNQFIALNDERAANRFLSEFSKLMRLVLDNSQHDFITLSEEKEIIELYLKLEHYRFRDKFEYKLLIDEGLPSDSIEIPPMLIQPYIENAIWHGLRYKEDHGELTVKFENDKDTVKVEITDNGIGRQRSRQLKTKNQQSHNSTGLKNTQERIKIINKVYHKKYAVEVRNLNEDGSGTCVTLILPLNGRH